MDGSLVSEIEAELTYGDARAEWIREACRQRLNDDDDCGTDADATPTGA